MSQTLSATSTDDLGEVIAQTVEAVRGGELIVLPTDTVYGIGCDAFNPDAVGALLAAKGRGRHMPPPVLVGNTETLTALAETVTEEVQALTEAFWPGALTIICRAQPSLMWDLGETQGTVALRMPDDEAALALLRATGPLAVSSANRTGFPAATTVADAESQLGQSVAVYVDGGPSRGGAPSTIVDATGPELTVVRPGAISTEELAAVVPVIGPPASG